MIDELEQLRRFGASVAPTESEVLRARRLLESAIQGELATPPASKHRTLRRTLAIAAALFALGTTAVIAVTTQFDPGSALETEGRHLRPESLRQERAVTSDGMTWTAYSYQTEDGLECLDFELSSSAGSVGSVGGCTSLPMTGQLAAAIGGVTSSGRYHQILSGRLSTEITSVRATSDDGQVLVDYPESGIWLILPHQPAASWQVEALDRDGVVQASTFVADPEISDSE